MSSQYPYQARALMRFKAQDATFVLVPNQLVTVISPTDQDADWLTVRDDHGGSGSVPAGFLIKVEPDPELEQVQDQDHQPHSANSHDSVHRPNSHDMAESILPSSEPEPAPKPPSEQKPKSEHNPELEPEAMPILTEPNPQPSVPVDVPATTQAVSESEPAPLPSTRPISTASLTPSFADTPSSPGASKAAPPPAPKSNALRDRIAMFNKAVPAPGLTGPSAPRSKPPLARKPIGIPAPVPAIETSQTSEPQSSQQEDANRAQAGMSAADAEESVRAGGSLKDRIRLLQQQQQHAPAADSQSTPPKAKREWKRPPAPPSADGGPALPGMMGPPPLQRLPSSEQQGDEPDVTVKDSETLASSDRPATEETNGEEEEDLARRRRIAERMAKLGGAKMGFGFPGPALAPKPPLLSHTSSEDNGATSQSARSRDPSPGVPPERIAMPAMPKRAGPPRRKPPTPSNTVPVPEEIPKAEEQPDSIPSLDTAAASKDHAAQLSDQDQLPLNANSELDPQMDGCVEPKTEESVEPPKNDALALDPSQRPSGQKFPSSSQDQLSPPRKKSTESTHDQSYAPIGSDDDETKPAPAPFDFSQFGDLPSRDEAVSARVEETAHKTDHISDPAHPSADEYEPHEPPAGSFERQNRQQLAFQEEQSFATHSSVYQGEPDEADKSVEGSPPLMDQSIGDYAYTSRYGETEPILATADSANVSTEEAPPIAVMPPSLGPVSRKISDEDQLPSPSASSFDSLAQKMAAMGGRPMMGGAPSLPSVISPRLDRRPSGPREPNSPLTSTISEAGSSGFAPQVSRSNSAQQHTTVNEAQALPPPAPSRPSPSMGAQENASEAENESNGSRNMAGEIADVRPAQILPEEDDADEEAARRRRIAERMAKMGGRSMMGGMMFNPGSSATKSSAATPPTSKTFPSPPAVPHPQVPSADGSPSLHSAPSPPRRAAPQAIPDLPADISDYTEDSEGPPPPIPPKRPSKGSAASTDLNSVPPSSPRPPMPAGYHNTPKRSSTLSQPGLSWASVEDANRPAEQTALAGQTYETECGEDTSLPGSMGMAAAPQQPRRSIPSLPPGSPIGNAYAHPGSHPTDVPSRPHRSDSFESGHSSQPMSTRSAQGAAGMSPVAHSRSNNMSDAAPAGSYTGARQGFKARDLDLASERWWRSRPVAPPSSVTALDDVLIRLQGSSSLLKGKPISQYEMVVIRDDYSKTVVSVKFGESEDEGQTELCQTHYPPPAPYSIAKLQELSHTLGPQIVARARAKEDEKGFKGLDGASLVKMIVQSVGLALEPVGQTYGEVVYRCEVHDLKGTHPEIDVKDDIRPGDVVASYGATFKGKGIGHVSMNLGTVLVPHVGIVAEHDVKKNKFKAYGIWHGKVELMSYRLDELKSGSIIVFRVLDRAFLED